MTADTRVAALAAAITISHPNGAAEHPGPGCAAAILAALPPDWCGHEAEIARLCAALEIIAAKPEPGYDATAIAVSARNIARAALKEPTDD